ncbi:NYN domain-containing protein [Moraxella nasicaprae]|uniref:NYN domain-containing protein n=1 Tax=Moraxella nasicaprae TaxID=2904122 RepID=A0ABY6F390_9GAMM|nr:NYN domain-containing protein [Moraxella nasicaprae]UXZ04563.1 NYN domain-containing protein [Moraxella nasicaprae]
MTTAVFIDGAFFVKRLRHYLPETDHYNAKKMADVAMGMALEHLKLRNQSTQTDDLYRVFFYDCPPLEKKMHRPKTRTALDLSKSDEAVFRRELHKELIQKRKFALRLGRLSDYSNGWRLKPRVLSELLKDKKAWGDLTDDDFTIDIMQKGVDMRIGVDIATVALKMQANRIVLIAGDADFVPAAKLARREGVDFILDAMHQPISDDLFEHIDGLRTTYHTKRKQK